MYKNLLKMKITDIACGESHTLLLNNRYEVYTVGHGSEGQLGLGKSIK